jgi:hypothetical protein
LASFKGSSGSGSGSGSGGGVVCGVTGSSCPEQESQPLIPSANNADKSKISSEFLNMTVQSLGVILNY